MNIQSSPPRKQRIVAAALAFLAGSPWLPKMLKAFETDASNATVEPMIAPSPARERRAVRPMTLRFAKALSMVALALVLQPAWLHAAFMDSPNATTGVVQSGIFPILGWKCEARKITIRFDFTTEYEAAYGTVRPDTLAPCADTNNGFSLLWNWNMLGDGTHVVEALDDGVVFASATVKVVTLGQEFPTGLNGSGLVSMSNGKQVKIEWSEPRQGFVITDVSDRSTLVAAGVWLGSGRQPLVLTCFKVSPDGSRLTIQGQGGACDNAVDEGASLHVVITDLASGCRAELRTKADIPIVTTAANTSFSYQQVVGDQTIQVTGVFQMANFATGTIRAVTSGTGAVCEGSWIATPF